MKIKQTKQFERSLKKLSKKHYPIELISTVLSAIINLDKVILLKSKDHSLSNNWQGYRSFHPGRLSKRGSKRLDNWIVIYKIDQDELVLTLVDTGDHDKIY